MKKGLIILSLLPAMASAHTGPIHNHPEELLSAGGILLAVIALGMWVSTKHKR